MKKKKKIISCPGAADPQGSNFTVRAGVEHWRRKDFLNLFVDFTWCEILNKSEKEKKQNKEQSVLNVFTCIDFTFRLQRKCLLTAFFDFFQTWRTLRLKDEALCRCARVKEWFFCAALLHTLEVRHPSLFSQAKFTTVLKLYKRILTDGFYLLWRKLQ